MSSRIPSSSTSSFTVRSGVAAEDGAAAYVSLERHDLGKDRAVEQDRVAADTLVRRDDNLRLGAAVLIGELIEGFGANEWLVRQDDEGGVDLRIERGEARLAMNSPFPARMPD